MRKIIAVLLVLICFLALQPADTFQNTVAATIDESVQKVDVPILMYHSVLKSKQGQYAVSPAQFKADLNYLKEHGYESVFVRDIIDFCEGTKELPKKPVVISFDDGHYNNYYYAYPILKEVGFKANLNVVGTYVEFSTSSGDCDNPNYSYVTWDEIKELKESGIFEIGNHTYNMHKYSPRFGIMKKQFEDDTIYKENLTKDILKLEDKLLKNCGFYTNVFAYPFGKYSQESNEILQEIGFQAFLTCNEGINRLQKGDFDGLLHLKRINRSGLMQTWQFFSTHKIN